MSEEVRELTCIVCPVGCKLKATIDGADISIEGNTCARGKKYGLDELCSPVRMITSTVKVDGGFLPRLPVRSASPIPKARVLDALAALTSVRMHAPVEMGQLVLRDVAGSGVDIIASRPMDRV
jgi:CxxC motif-containing protein